MKVTIGIIMLASFFLGALIVLGQVMGFIILKDDGIGSTGNGSTCLRFPLCLKVGANVETGMTKVIIPTSFIQFPHVKH